MRVSMLVVSAALVTAALLVSACETATKQAPVQDLKPDKRRAAIAIEVTAPNGACRYELKTVDGTVQLSDAEHDRFEMRAGGVLIATAIGTSAQIRIEDDTTKKVKGYYKKGVLSLQNGDDDVLRIRKAKKPPGSLHRVSIHCCRSLEADPSKDAKGGGVVCVDSVQADDLTSPGTKGSTMNSASIMPLEFLNDGFFFETEPEPEPVPPLPGGPDMDVHP